MDNIIRIAGEFGTELTVGLTSIGEVTFLYRGGAGHPAVPLSEVHGVGVLLEWLDMQRRRVVRGKAAQSGYGADVLGGVIDAAVWLLTYGPEYGWKLPEDTEAWLRHYLGDTIPDNDTSEIPIDGQEEEDVEDVRDGVLIPLESSGEVWTIVLTDEAPVKIKTSAWRRIALASTEVSTGGMAIITLVRESKVLPIGSTIVFGRKKSQEVGYLLRDDDDSLVKVVRKVALELNETDTGLAEKILRQIRPTDLTDLT